MAAVCLLVQSHMKTRKKALFGQREKKARIFFYLPKQDFVVFFGTFFEADQSVENSQFIGRLQLLLFSEGKDQS